METPFPTLAPTKLYAFLIKLRPLQQGTLMAFSGELVHGAWLKWLSYAAPDVANWLHEGNKRRLFTCSSLQFPIPTPRMREAERDNIHLPLDPEKTYTVTHYSASWRAFPPLLQSTHRLQHAKPRSKQTAIHADR